MADSQQPVAGSVGDVGPAAGATLVSFARESIEHYVREGERPEPPAEDKEVLWSDRGAFVTLEHGEQLRGCTGRPTADGPLIETVGSMAVSAATADPRFDPVSAGELDAVTVSVNVLSPMVPIEHEPDRYPEVVTVGRDGLRVTRGSRTGLLLPSVGAERDWDATTFLAHTCRKARLPTDAWQDPATTVERFRTAAFAERAPGVLPEP